MGVASHQNSDRAITAFRFILIVFGTLVTWAFLINLLQVNFDLNQLSFINTVQEHPQAKKDQQAPQVEQSYHSKQNNFFTFFSASPKSYTIQLTAHEDLAHIFSQVHLSKKLLAKLKILPLFYNYHEQFLHSGESLHITIQGHRLKKLIYPMQDDKQFVVTYKDNALHAHIESKDGMAKIAYASGHINNSLYMALKKANLNASLAMSLKNIFDAKLNFAKNLHKNDAFKILYLKHYRDGKLTHMGPVLAAQLVTKNHIYTALRNAGKDGQTNYYTPTGDSLKKAFLRAPVKYVFISSPFNLHRKHPVLHIVRPHKGVDLAANKGTPIHAASSGVIKFSGRKGGYGNVIIIRHSSKYSTRYAHMNRFADHIHKGVHVKKG
jgi:murein DD-endopeptidase MepM/ murein hydrolase activator NlpD